MTGFRVPLFLRGEVIESDWVRFGGRSSAGGFEARSGRGEGGTVLGEAFAVDGIGEDHGAQGGAEGADGGGDCASAGCGGFGSDGGEELAKGEGREVERRRGRVWHARL